MLPQWMIITLPLDLSSLRVQCWPHQERKMTKYKLTVLHRLIGLPPICEGLPVCSPSVCLAEPEPGSRFADMKLCCFCNDGPEGGGGGGNYRDVWREISEKQTDQPGQGRRPDQTPGAFQVLEKALTRTPADIEQSKTPLSRLKRRRRCV